MKTVTPYKTAAELGIEQWEHDGLVALVGPLSRGELAVFSMCGSYGCIGGHVAARSGRYKYVPDYVMREHSKTLCRLYFPNKKERRLYPRSPWYATAAQAARAIVNFLTLGDPRWCDVMRESADFDADDSGAVEHVIDRQRV